jgi:DNA processing protein
VVGTGLDHCYPSVHAALYEEIVLAGGALVSPFEPARQAALFTFHVRNSVLAALTLATVVVQAPARSGARSTAKYARRLRRPLFVLPAALWDDRSAGNIAEIGLGARPLTDEAHLFDLLGVSSPRRAHAAPVPHFAPPTARAPNAEAAARFIARLSSPHRAVLQAIEKGPRHLDDLCAETGLTAALVHEALLTLTLEAVLVEGPAGWFRRASVG